MVAQIKIRVGDAVYNKDYIKLYQQHYHYCDFHEYIVVSDTNDTVLPDPLCTFFAYGEHYRLISLILNDYKNSGSLLFDKQGCLKASFFNLII